MLLRTWSQPGRSWRGRGGPGTLRMRSRRVCTGGRIRIRRRGSRARHQRSSCRSRNPWHSDPGETWPRRRWQLLGVQQLQHHSRRRRGRHIRSRRGQPQHQRSSCLCSRSKLTGRKGWSLLASWGRRCRGRGRLRRSSQGRPRPRRRQQRWRQQQPEAWTWWRWWYYPLWCQSCSDDLCWQALPYIPAVEPGLAGR